MPLAPGTRLGAYEIVGLIGAGGMGEVYKARDGRLESNGCRQDPPVLLFDRPYSHGEDPTGFIAFGGYDVAADGRFLMIPEAGGEPNRAAAPATGIVVVQNWVEELKQRLPK